MTNGGNNSVPSAPKWTSVDEVIAQITREGLSSLPFSHDRFEVGMAEGLVYSMEGNNLPVLRVTTKEINPLNLHYEDFRKSVEQDQFYPISPADFENIKNDPQTVTIDLEKLGRESENPNAPLLICLPLSTRKPILGIGGYNWAGYETRKLAKSLFGHDNNFEKTMKLFQNYQIKEILMHVISPHFVAKYVTQAPTVFATRLSINKIDDKTYRIGVMNSPFYPSSGAQK